jgi:CheY-like chemotaxis protein
MGGTIDVTSATGRGTRISLKLPIAWGEAARHWPSVPPIAPMRARIDVPVPAMAASVRAMLAKMGVTRVGAHGTERDVDISLDPTGALIVAVGRSERRARSIDEFIETLGPGAPRASRLGEALQRVDGEERNQAPDVRRDATAFGEVLVVEDNEINRDIILRQLAALGVTASGAADGVEGYTCWERLRPRFLLLDCHMPGIDGYTLARRIRAGEAGGPAAGVRTTIVAISANSTPDDMGACREAGMDDYLAKPITRQKLVAIFEKWRETADAVKP